MASSLFLKGTSNNSGQIRLVIKKARIKALIIDGVTWLFDYSQPD